jgi:hypothetical protein
MIYILDIEWFIKTFFNEIRHIESCLKYQAANWEKVQAKVAMNESYRVLIQLIDEILNAYDLKHPGISAASSPCILPELYSCTRCQRSRA